MGARNRVGIELSCRPARLHRLAELVPLWHWFLGSLKFKKFEFRMKYLRLLSLSEDGTVHRLNMGIRSPKFIWAPVYSCTHWLRPRTPSQIYNSSRWSKKRKKSAEKIRWDLAKKGSRRKFAIRGRGSVCFKDRHLVRKIDGKETFDYCSIC